MNADSQPHQALGVFVDWSANARNPKAQLILLAYRICRRFHLSGRVGKIIGMPLFITYRILVEWVLGVELGWHVQAGPRLRIFHGVGLVVHPAAVLGADCTLRHGTTLGTKHKGGPAPIVEDSVDIGCNAVLLGGIRIGHDSSIGAGSVVISDVAPHSVVAGNPARPVGRGRQGPGNNPR